MRAVRARAAASSRLTPITYQPGIDGLRALAVVAVLLYHADVGWMPAGFLGVDVFFVVSGYLICSLLLAEWSEHGRIRVPSFWMRRVRRLLPAFLVMLFVVALVGPPLAHDSVPQLRIDLLPALGYVSNWWQILHHQSYFQGMGRPPLLRHVWSLAVEEQFYLVFPLLLVVGLKVTRGRRHLLGLAALVVGAGSTLAMALLWHPAVDPSRVYYGTDTRGVGLCVGVALACVLPLGRARADLVAGARAILDGAGLAALVALALLMTRLTEFSPWLYRGGFALTSLAAAVAVAVASHPGAGMSRVLGMPALQWIGTRSYAIYLWHWPVFMLTRPRLDIALSGPPLMAFRLVVVAALAEASFLLVEQPFRSGQIQRLWRAWPSETRVGVASAVWGAVVLLVPGLLLIQPPAQQLLAGETTVTTLLTSAPVVLTPAAETPEPQVAEPVAEAPVADAAPETTLPPPVTAPVRRRVAGPPTTVAPAPPPAPAPISLPDGEVLAIGDSVMVGAKAALTDALGGRVSIDAAVGRQVDGGLDVLQTYRDAGALDRVAAVVIHLGTNGPMASGQFDRLARIMTGVPRVVVLNVRVPKRWEGQSNSSIENGIREYPAMRLGNWYEASMPSGVIGSDGVHPTPSGARVYAQVVAEGVAGSEPVPEPVADPATTVDTAPPPPDPAPTTTTLPLGSASASATSGERR